MLKIPNIATYLKIYKHFKKQSAEALLAQIGEFHLQVVLYNLPYNSLINTPLNWWKMCVPILSYLQLLAIKLFFIIRCILRDDFAPNQREKLVLNFHISGEFAVSFA